MLEILLDKYLRMNSRRRAKQNDENKRNKAKKYGNSMSEQITSIYFEEVEEKKKINK